MQVAEHGRRRMGMARLANLCEGDCPGRAGVGQDVIKLVFAVLHRYRRHHHAQPGAGQVHHKLFDAIGHHGHQNVVAAYPVVEQHSAEAVNLVCQLIPGQASGFTVCELGTVGRIDHGFPVAPLAYIVGKVVPQRLRAPPATCRVVGNC